MAGKITSDDLMAALASYQAAHPEAKLEKVAEDSYLLTEGSESCSVALEDGKISCARSQAVKEALIGYIMDAREGSPKMPVNGGSQPSKAIMPSQPRKAGNGALVKPGAVITEEDIRNYLCPNASPQEILMAAKMCQLRGMNWGDVHFIKYGNSPLTIVAGKEHFTKKAEANAQFDGFKAGIIVKSKDGSYQEREGTFYMDEELVGGWASVWRKDRKEPFVQKVRLSAFNTGKALWAKMPEVMVRKCALVNALREAFPGDLGGVYDSSEMGQAIDADFEEMGAA